jgi:Glycosyltransferase Family 4
MKLWILRLGRWIVDVNAGSWKRVGRQVDVVIDTIGGHAAARSLDVLWPGLLRHR